MRRLEGQLNGGEKSEKNKSQKPSGRSTEKKVVSSCSEGQMTKVEKRHLDMASGCFGRGPDMQNKFAGREGAHKGALGKSDGFSQSSVRQSHRQGGRASQGRPWEEWTL